jgi:hypothetical protein
MNIILRIVLITIFFTSNIAFSQTKVWFKPKSVDDSFKLERDKCFSTTGVRDINQPIVSTCMTQNGWTLIESSIIKNDESECSNKAKENPKTYRKVYLSCMLSKGWDLLSKSEEIITRLNEEILAICEKEEYKEYYKKTPCNSNNITFEQLADNSKISENEKKTLIVLINLTDKLTKEQDEARRFYGGFVDRKYAEYRNDVVIPQVTAYRLDLYNGKMTWAQYNQKRKDILKESNDKLKLIRDELQVYLKSQ